VVVEWECRRQLDAVAGPFGGIVLYPFDMALAWTLATRSGNYLRGKPGKTHQHASRNYQNPILSAR
jgi:hypothetical protein